MRVYVGGRSGLLRTDNCKSIGQVKRTDNRKYVDPTTCAGERDCVRDLHACAPWAAQQPLLSEGLPTYESTVETVAWNFNT